MPLSRGNYAGGRNRDPKAKATLAAGIILALISVLRTVTGFVMRGLRNFGSVSAILAVIVVLSVIGIIAGLIAGRLQKKHAPWSFAKSSAKSSEEDLMHLDHYRRTNRERTHHSADPCAYSERYSWRKSQAYDDPWDF